MNITWLGHSCFKIETGGKTLVTDPYDPKIGLTLPKDLTADIVTVSHQHFDHSYTAAVGGEPKVINQPGQYEIGGTLITGVPTFHDNKQGTERGGNTVFVIESEGIRVVHLGDLGHLLSEDQIKEIGRTDILLVPVGGHYTIDPVEAKAVVDQLDPKIVVPMHMKRAGVDSPLAGVEEFVKLMSIESEKMDRIDVSSGDLSSAEQKVIMLNASGNVSGQ